MSQTLWLGSHERQDDIYCSNFVLTRRFVLLYDHKFSEFIIMIVLQKSNDENCHRYNRFFFFLENDCKKPGRKHMALATSFAHPTYCVTHLKHVKCAVRDQTESEWIIWLFHFRKVNSPLPRQGPA